VDGPELSNLFFHVLESGSVGFHLLVEEGAGLFPAERLQVLLLELLDEDVDGLRGQFRIGMPKRQLDDVRRRHRAHDEVPSEAIRGYPLDRDRLRRVLEELGVEALDRQRLDGAVDHALTSQDLDLHVDDGGLAADQRLAIADLGPRDHLPAELDQKHRRRLVDRGLKQGDG
jgi:hypothetical protein